MRTITLRFAGECRACNATLETGSSAAYERVTGIFCVGCAPTDPEVIRNYRQERADRKADRYEGWAEKRHVKADALRKVGASYRHDWAFITQPGHIPERARMNARDERAWEHEKTATRFEQKAASLRHVVVKGDAERKREVKREKALDWVSVGMEVNDPIYGVGVVKRIHKVSVTLDVARGSGSITVKAPLHWIVPANDAALALAKVNLDARKASEQ